jgi:predicted HTH domain antitoxin
VSHALAVSYSEVQDTGDVRLPADLIRVAGWNPAAPSTEASRLLALEFYREDKLSLGRAAELCQTSVEQFLEFAGRHNVLLHYGLDQLEEYRRTLERLGL